MENQNLRYDANKKSLLVAYLLLLFLGGLGLHRFYLKRTISAFIMVGILLISIPLSFVVIGFFGFLLLGIWYFIDLFLLPGMVTSYNNNLIDTLENNSSAAT